MAKKGKGFFGALGSALSSIPVVGKVKKAAKKKLKKAKKKLKKALKKAKKKLKKKLGKVLTKARKLKNNLSKSKLVKRFKRAVKKAVLAVKKAVKKAKKYVKATVKKAKTYAKAAVKKGKTNVKAAVKQSPNAKSNKANKAAASIVQKSKYINLENSCPVSANSGEPAKKPGLFLTALSIIADFVPYLGNAKAGFEVTEGYNPITKEKLDSVDQGLSAAGIILGGIGKYGGKGVKFGYELLSESKNATNVAETAANSSKNIPVDDFNLGTATNKQKGNYGEIKSSDNLLNNQSLKDAGYDLKPMGKGAPSSVNDKIVKGIDGLYENTNSKSNIKYVIDEEKFGSSQLSKTPKDGPQMSDDWLKGTKTKKDRILKAVDGDKELAQKITDALDEGKVERVLSKVDSSGKVKTYRIDAKGDIIGEWP
ncbi:vacuolar-type H+-ATPase subunit H [Lysinibacillus sp. RC46]|uniref:pre-toxin TG domain-containing protein n=1 Tax=Lysinibacillus sp. RC46 TaxID=3156295 RepID=UPI003510D390